MKTCHLTRLRERSASQGRERGAAECTAEFLKGCSFNASSSRRSVTATNCSSSWTVVASASTFRLARDVRSLRFLYCGPGLPQWLDAFHCVTNTIRRRPASDVDRLPELPRRHFALGRWRGKWCLTIGRDCSPGQIISLQVLYCESLSSYAY